MMAMNAKSCGMIDNLSHPSHNLQRKSEFIARCILLAHFGHAFHNKTCFLTVKWKKKCLHLCSRKYHYIPSDTKAIIISEKQQLYQRVSNKSYLVWRDLSKHKLLYTSGNFLISNQPPCILHFWTRIRLYYIPYIYLCPFWRNSLVFDTLM